MADIRINSLPTTASASSSDDFLALDGATNGTRKLNAYSPTFGGNLTVSGTGNSSVAGNLGIGETSPVVPLHVKTTGTGTGDFDNAIATLRSTAAGRTITLQFSDTTNQSYISSKSGALNFGVGGATLGMSLSSAGNLTVSGRDLTLGSSESVIYFGTPSANYLYYNGSSLFLRVGSVDRITIPGGTGNVLIGTTTDGGQKLQVAGAIAATTGAANNALVARYNSSNSLFGVTVNSAGQGVVSENTDASTGSDKYSKTGLPAFRLGNTGGSGTVPFWIDVAASGTAGNAITWTNAFQIDSSQNATFAGNVVLGAGKRVAYSASAYMTPENNVDGAEIASPGQFTVKTASTQALKIDSSQNATFAGTVTASTAGNYVLQLKDTRSQAADVGASIGLQGTYTGSLQTTFGSILGLKVNSTDGNFAGKLVFQTRPNGGSLTTALTLDDSQNATFAGNIASASKYDNTGTTSIAGSSTATIYTFPNASNKVYLVTVRQQGSAANNAMAMVFTNGTSASVTRIAQDNTNAALTIDFSFSGLSLQVTPGSGYGTTTWERTITNIK